jgi:hypothetical protein
MSSRQNSSRQTAARSGRNKGSQEWNSPPTSNNTKEKSAVSGPSVDMIPQINRDVSTYF